MNAYFDTSAVVAMMLAEDSGPAVTDWMIRHAATPIFSDLGRGEVIATLGTKVRAGKLTRHEAGTVIAQLDRWLLRWQLARCDFDDQRDAASFLERYELALRLPDALHIAIARRSAAVLVTLDKGQQRAAIALGLDVVDPAGT